MSRQKEIPALLIDKNVSFFEPIISYLWGFTNACQTRGTGITGNHIFCTISAIVFIVFLFGFPHPFLSFLWHFLGHWPGLFSANFRSV